MSITITGRKMTVRDDVYAYAEEKIGNAMKVIDIDPLDAEVVLYRERNQANPKPAVCEVTVRVRGHVVRVEENEEDLLAAIDIAAVKVVRQLRKFKTRVIEKKSRVGAAGALATIRDTKSGDLDFDALMEDLSDEEIVRVKEVDFKPLTEEEAIIQMDLLSHDFFGFIERDSNQFAILYRRDDGGYGLLKQKEEE